MIDEIGFYAPAQGWGQQSRVAAIARHLPASMVYVLQGGDANLPLDYFGIDWFAVDCSTPGCSGVSPQGLAAWIADRNPRVLVMDASPYGRMQEECREYVKLRGAVRTFFVYRRSPSVESRQTLNPNDFTAILKTEDGPVPGEEMFPLLPFDPHEILPRSQARVMLGAEEAKPLVLILAERATPHYVGFVEDLCRKRGITSVVYGEYPVMPMMAGADLIVGHAGTAVNEAAAVGVPMQAIEGNRSLDQVFRANATPDSIRVAIDGLEVLEPWAVTYKNYARRAAALIAGSPTWRQVDV